MTQRRNSRPKTHAKYWASGNNLSTVEEKKESPLYIERNSAANMYRINSRHSRGVPVELMGYNPHLSALRIKLAAYERRVARRKLG